MKARFFYFKYLVVFMIINFLFNCSIKYNLSDILTKSENSSGGSSNTSFIENFEDGNINDWLQGTEYPAYSFSIVIPPVGGTVPPTAKCLQIVSNSSLTAMQGIYKNIGKYSPKYISLFMYFQDNYSGGYNWFMLSNNHSYSTRVIYFNYDGSNLVFNDTTTIGCTTGLWYFIELRNLDWINKKYDVYINNVNMASGVSMHSMGVTDSFNCIDIYNTTSNNPKGFIDDIYMHM